MTRLLRRTLAPVAAGAALLAAAAPARGQAAPASAVAPARSFQVEVRGYGVRQETEPPRYVRPANRTGLPGFDNVDWLDIGVEVRGRFEHRDSDYRRPVDAVDDAVLLRSRLYLGVRQRFDPLRFVLEVADGRRNSGPFTIDDREVNVFEPIQAFAELYFKDGAGTGRPISIKVGRHAFEALDRRLIARNEWRNTTNTFDGVRATVGRQQAAWQVDVVALRPVRRLKTELDRPESSQLLAGAIGDWRRWSNVATFQPYYLRLTQDGDRAANGVTRDVHTLGLRTYGLIGKTGWDWDINAVRQTGEDGPRDQRSAAVVVEAGYTARHRWKPRLSGSYAYGSGDRNPVDGANNRFERLFGFARPFSASDYIQWENLRAPKLRIEVAPVGALRIDAGVSGYWLDSATDRWNAAGLRDATGRSGTSIGREVDVRVRFPVGPRVGLNLGYARFAPGAFTRTTSGRDTASHMPYVEVTFLPYR